MLLGVAMSLAAVAQPQNLTAPHSNVAAYDNEDGIAKLEYRESPYYLEISGTWKQRHTDSSLIYTKQIDAEKSWKDYLVYLNVRCGRACRVYLNDKPVGYGDDSRHWNEFQLNKYLKYGKPNKLAIEAMKHPRGAMLEDTAIRVGLNGEPYILFKNDPNVSDFSLLTDYDSRTEAGTLTVDAKVFCSRKKGRYYMEVEVWNPQGRQLDRMGRWVVFDGKNEETIEVTRTWPGVEPWNAESPRLYTAVIRLRNEKMEEEEMVGAKFGFRRVEVIDGLLKLNGRPITFKGITYGLEHTEGLSSREQMRRDVELMKQCNINAVRTSRFSPMDPYFYELCDKNGLYVVCDANLMPLSTQHAAVATDQEFAPDFERRMDNLYEAYKNHTSIIAWSLGDTRDNGVCMTAAFKHLKSLEKNRPVIFSGADFGENTDVIALEYPTKQILLQALDKPGERPILMLAAVDVHHFVALEDLWKEVQNRRSLQGGFVDIWPLSKTIRSELSHLYKPFDVSISKITQDDGEFVIRNLNDFTSLSDYSLEYTIFTNLRPNIIAGDLPVAVSAGESDKVTLRLPQLDMMAGEELFVRFNLYHRRKVSSKVSAGTVYFTLPCSKGPRYPLQTVETVNDTTLPATELFFIGHEDWRMEQMDRIVRHLDGGTICDDRMLQFLSPGGTVMCDVRETRIQYGTGDVVVDYTVVPTDRPQVVLHPAVRMRHHSDSVSWFGLDRSVLFAKHNSGQVGTFSAKIENAIERQQVRWCSVTSNQKGLFARIIDDRFCMQVADSTLSLIPSQGASFRVHLRQFEQEDYTDFLAIDFPQLSAGFSEPPVISASSTRFSEPLTITLSTKQSDGPAIIRYTLDGSEPTETSPVYKVPIVLTTTTIVKARVFSKDMPPSFTSTRKFNYDYIVRTTFSRKPNTPYNVGTDTILYDGEKAVVDDLSHGWIGFSGTPVITTVNLSKPLDVDYVVLRYAHSPATWAFSPRSVSIAFSADGETFQDTITFTVPFDPSSEANNTAQVVELKIPVDRASVQAINVIPQTIGTIPAWHRAKGLRPWLLMDEIEVSEKL